MAPRAERRRRSARRPRRRARGGVGRHRGCRVRRRVADGRVGAQPGRCGPRPGRRRPRRRLPGDARRLLARRRRRVAVLHPRLLGRPALGGHGRPRLGAGRARPAGPRPHPRLRPEPRRTRPPLDDDPSRALRPGNGRRPPQRPRVVRRGGRAGARQRARPVLPGVARRRAARRLLACAARRGGRDAAADRRPVRRCSLRHGDARDERHVRPDVGGAGRRPARRRLLADGDPRRAGHPSRVPVHRRGLLGPRVGIATAGVRLLLRQAPLRPSGARGRRAGP